MPRSSSWPWGSDAMEGMADAVSARHPLPGLRCPGALLLISAGLAAGAQGPGAGPSRVHAPEALFDFGKARRGETVSHEFAIANQGPGTLEILGIDTAEPALSVRAPRRLRSGAAGVVTLRLDTGPFLRGRIAAGVVLETNDPAAPRLEFTLAGLMEQPVDVQPFEAIFLSAYRGEESTGSVRILNNTDTPIRPALAPFSSPRVECHLEELRTGREYALHARLLPGAGTGQAAEALLLETGLVDPPRLKILVHSQVKERVHVEPAELDFGVIDLAELDRNPDLLPLLSRLARIRSKTGNLRIRARTDLPFVMISVANPQQAEVAELRVRLDRSGLKLGEFRGRIWIETNDAEFPTLEILVTGRVRPSPGEPLR